MTFKVWLNPPESVKMIARFTMNVISCERVRIAMGFVELYKSEADLDNKKPFLIVNRDIVLMMERVE